METLEDSHNLQASNSNSSKTTTTTKITPTIPNEIIFFDILSRLPVKYLLQFRCVSKHWSSFIRNPLFASHYLSLSIADRLRGSRLLISVYDHRSSEQHFLSAGVHGGPSDHLFKLSDSPSLRTLSEHVNGLFLIHRNGFTISNNFVYICNPSTREFAPLPIPHPIVFSPSVQTHVCYNLGFDDSTYEHKVLSIRVDKFRSSSRNASKECRVFSLRTNSWRKIDPVIPFNLSGSDWLYGSKNGVCVNGAIHWMLWNEKAIAAFDMKEEKFHMISLPHGVVDPFEEVVPFGFMWGMSRVNRPFMIQMNGLLAIICCDHVREQSLMEMWILKDYENEVWVMESINIPSSLEYLDGCYPRGTIYTGEVLLKPQRMQDRVCIPFYDVRDGSFRIVEIGLPPELLSLDDVEFTCSSDYIESVSSLRRRG